MCMWWFECGNCRRVTCGIVAVIITTCITKNDGSWFQTNAFPEASDQYRQPNARLEREGNTEKDFGSYSCPGDVGETIFTGETR